MYEKYWGHNVFWHLTLYYSLMLLLLQSFTAVTFSCNFYWWKVAAKGSLIWCTCNTNLTPACGLPQLEMFTRQGWEGYLVWQYNTIQYNTIQYNTIQEGSAITYYSFLTYGPQKINKEINKFRRQKANKFIYIYTKETIFKVE